MRLFTETEIEKWARAIPSRARNEQLHRLGVGRLVASLLRITVARSRTAYRLGWV